VVDLCQNIVALYDVLEILRSMANGFFFGTLYTHNTVDALVYARLVVDARFVKLHLRHERTNKETNGQTPGIEFGAF